MLLCNTFNEIIATQALPRKGQKWRVLASYRRDNTLQEGYFLTVQYFTHAILSLVSYIYSDLQLGFIFNVKCIFEFNSCYVNFRNNVSETQLVMCLLLVTAKYSTALVFSDCSVFHPCNIVLSFLHIFGSSTWLYFQCKMHI